MGLYYRIILRDHITEFYYGIIFMKRIPEMPGTFTEPPGIPWIPWARPWDPLGRFWDPQACPWDPPGTPLGPPETRLGPPGTPVGAPRDAPRTPRDSYGPQNGHSSTNLQRQKLSIAVFKPARWGPSHEALDRA